MTSVAFQPNLRKQIRKLPKILESVEIIQYYSILFMSLVTTTDCCEICRKLDLRGAMAKEMRIQDPQGMGAPLLEHAVQSDQTASLKSFRIL